MSRVIKFRAWSKKQGKLGVVSNWNAIAHGKDILEEEYVCLSPWNGNECWGVIDIEHIELMQFTGLLDKDGKEIYEEDILSFEIPRTTRMNKKPTIHHHEVYWNGDKGQWWIRHGEMHQAIGSHSSECQVIGNIYENPELLGV